MKLPLRASAVAFLAAVLLFGPAPASATTIDPLLFEELVLGADLVGVVECRTAGGIVAEYTVVESWKGPKAGTRVTIRTAVNYWEPQFPIALCGERYFVTAYKEAPDRVVSTAGGGGVPLWWRDLPADYHLPLFQGRQLFAPGEEKGPDFAKTRKAAQDLLALPPAKQEAALLKAVIDKDLFGRKWRGGESDAAKAKELRARLAGVADADALTGELLGLAKADPDKWAVRVRIVLGKAGGAATLARLEKVPADRSPWEKEELAGLVAEIKERRGASPAPPAAKKATPDKDAVPDAGELARLRKVVAGGPGAEEFGEAFEALTRHDPGAVAEFLVGWRKKEAEWQDADRGYVLGSYFAWKCGRDRATHLAALTKAVDPFVRVAGAVYLCFEDLDAGTAALKKLTALDGDPGAWAALTLARRGDKDALPRALRVFRDPPPGPPAERTGMSGVPHGNLQKRVLVLLSNAAQAGRAPQPAVPKAEGEQWEYLAGWWKDHGGKAVLRDPWLKALEKQKVD
jgi:hypothetical protein